MLSQIEREQANPTLAVTLRIAHAFAIDLGDLVNIPNAASSLKVIRANDRTFHYRSDKNC
jgi:transcriptional regulator with XRE-family HTH domain